MHVSSITQENAIRLLLLDRPLDCAECFACSLSESGCQEQLALFYMHAMKVLSPDVTGVSLCPEISFGALNQKAQNTGVVFGLEDQMIEQDPLSLPKLSAGWGMEQVRNNYGLAKLTLFFHPAEELGTRKRQFVAELYDYAHHEGIDFVLDLQPIHNGDIQQLVLQSVQELRGMADLFILPPTDPITAVTITAELDVPWILSAHDLRYDEYKEQLRIALEGGAAGFGVGLPLWRDVIQSITTTQSVTSISQELDKLLKTVVRDRFLELSRITQEHCRAE